MVKPSARHIGLLIFVLSPLSAMAYALGLFYTPTLVLKLMALAAVIGIFSILTWIGYMLLTKPSLPEASDREHILEPQKRLPPTTDATTLNMSVVKDVEIGQNTIIRDHVNLYKCKIGSNCRIGSFVYIEECVVIGDNCKIKAHVFIPTGIIIENDVFVGPNVVFTNDKYPRVRGEWKVISTRVKQGASIGAHSVILPGVTIGRNAMVGAGSVVTSNVSDGTTVSGNPARVCAHA